MYTSEPRRYLEQLNSSRVAAISKTERKRGHLVTRLRGGSTQTASGQRGSAPRAGRDGRSQEARCSHWRLAPALETR